MTTETVTIRTASSQGLALCKACHYLQPCPAGQAVDCLRCGATVNLRTPHSLVRCWFFLILAMLLLIPANLLPMMDIAPDFIHPGKQKSVRDLIAGCDLRGIVQIV